MRFLLVLASLALATGQEAKEGTAGDAQKLVTIQKIAVEGTRLPARSVIRLAQIQVGDQVNFVKLNDALQKVMRSGLISHIDFEYESLPDKETDVILHMKCTDEKPVAKASIQIPKVNEEEVWTWLANVDPILTRDMPPTEAAIRLYSFWIGKYMEDHGDPNFKKRFSVVANASSSTGGDATDRLIFKVTKLRSAK
jgi:hypothetical protein